MTENEIAKLVVDAAIKVHSRLGLLLNFGADLMKEGIKRIANGLEEHT